MILTELKKWHLFMFFKQEFKVAVVCILIYIIFIYPFEIIPEKTTFRQWYVCTFYVPIVYRIKLF